MKAAIVIQTKNGFIVVPYPADQTLPVVDFTADVSVATDIGDRYLSRPNNVSAILQKLFEPEVFEQDDK